MLMESVTTVLHGVTEKSEPELGSGQEPELTSETYDPKSEPELGSEQEAKLPSESYDPISEESDEEGSDEEVSDEEVSDEEGSDEEESGEDPMSEGFDEFYEADELYLNDSNDPYDAIPVPQHSRLCGGYRPIRLIDITDEDDKKDLPMIKKLAETALLFHQKGSGASFEFHELVRCTYLIDCHPNKYGRDHLRYPTEYYITFQAKPTAKGDPSNSRDITTTFQATVLVDVVDKTKHVEECRIKI